jgi:hypothetical protein
VPTSARPVDWSFTFPAHSGNQWLDLTGAVSNSPTGVAQTINTTPGSNYTLTFWVGNVYDPSGHFGMTSTVDVFQDGNALISATNTHGARLNKLVWQKFTKTFTDTAAETTLSFINGDPPTDNSNGLDAISVQ